MKEQKRDFPDSVGGKEIERTLIECHGPLINLGLALYAKLSRETTLSLFQNGDRTIKKAVLAGPSIEYCDYYGASGLPGFGILHGDFKEIVDSFDEELLRPALSNGSIPDELLVRLYEKREPFASLTDEQWIRAIGCTVSNPRLSTPYDGPMDAFSEVPYRKVFTAGWKLFETLPVNNSTAVVLSYLGESLLPKSHDMDVHATIKRWEAEGDGKSNY